MINLGKGCWIIYQQKMINEPDLFFSKILKEIGEDLEQKYVTFSGKQFKVPRLISWYGEKEYTYSGIVHKKKEIPQSLKEIKNLYLKDFSCLNSVLCNYYRDGQDSVSWHSDDEEFLGPKREDVIIASISLGAPRRFIMREMALGQKLEFELGNGDILIMGGRTQQVWQHQIPKTSKKVEPRLNLTYRCII